MSELAVADLDILWITAGLSCDGDTIAITAATQPSIEDILLGVLPGIPKVRLHNPVLAYQNGNDFLEPFRLAAEGKLGPFVLVVEGSIPNEANKSEGVWAGFGLDARPVSRSRPATGSTGWRRRRGRLSRPAHVRSLRRDSRDGRQSNGVHGAGGLSRLGVSHRKRPADRQRSRLSRSARQLHGSAALSASPGSGHRPR